MPDRSGVSAARKLAARAKRIGSLPEWKLDSCWRNETLNPSASFAKTVVCCIDADQQGSKVAVTLTCVKYLRAPAS
jgi:hypothetical protein